MIVLTGFPGFLGSELLPRILARTEEEVTCLVQRKFRPLAEKRKEEIEQRAGRGRIHLVEADITRPLDHVPADDVREIYHFAAVYDLAVRRDTGMAVNVTGTRMVLDLARRARKLERFHYVSTCYVSGRWEGTFLENDLQKGQRFNNYYEETKYLAEAEVRARMGDVPATIYRPAVVVGDSSTGATQKFDGPYFVMQWLLRQPRLAVLPVAGDPKRYRFNVVPSDFVIGAMAYLSGIPASLGRTYALADPSPLTVDETIDLLAEATGRRVVRIPLPLAVAKGALAHVPGVHALMRIPPQAVDYFVHPTTYDTAHASADLALAGIRAPALRSYVANLVAFARKHPEISGKAMA